MTSRVLLHLHPPLCWPGRRVLKERLLQERTVAKYFVKLIYATTDGPNAQLGSNFKAYRPSRSGLFLSVLGTNIFTAKHLQRIRQIETRCRPFQGFL